MRKTCIANGGMHGGANNVVIIKFGHCICQT